MTFDTFAIINNRKHTNSNDFLDFSWFGWSCCLHGHFPGHVHGGFPRRPQKGAAVARLGGLATSTETSQEAAKDASPRGHVHGHVPGSHHSTTYYELQWTTTDYKELLRNHCELL